MLCRILAQSCRYSGFPSLEESQLASALENLRLLKRLPQISDSELPQAYKALSLWQL